jgi:hypothetical protein
MTTTMVNLAQKEKLAQDAANESESMLALLHSFEVTTKESFEECAAILKDVTGRIKFLDEERKISVEPLNHEVKRINGWFKPALDRLKDIQTTIKTAMARYEVRQREEQQRLMAAAAAEAQRVLVTNPEGMAGAQALVTQAAAAQAPTVSGVSGREVWTWEVVDEVALDRRFLMPNPKAIEAWVKEHGDKDVPAGVKVVRDVRYIVRS